MNLNKSRDYFDPEKMYDPIHVIGVGAIGSTLVENLVRLGISEINIYDFDVVSEHNVANQMFDFKQIGMLKVDAIEEIAKRINPEVKIIKHPEGCNPEDDMFEGYVFLCVDNIDIRKQIINTNRFNTDVIAMFDGRMRLTDAQHYACVWEQDDIDRLLKTMNFTQEEAEASTPVSACGTSLNVVYIVRLIVGYIVANFVNYIKTGELKHMILADAENFLLDCF